MAASGRKGHPGIAAQFELCYIIDCTYCYRVGNDKVDTETLQVLVMGADGAMKYNRQDHKNTKKHLYNYLQRQRAPSRYSAPGTGYQTTTPRHSTPAPFQYRTLMQHPAPHRATRHSTCPTLAQHTRQAASPRPACPAHTRHISFTAAPTSPARQPTHACRTVYCTHQTEKCRENWLEACSTPKVPRYQESWQALGIHPAVFSQGKASRPDPRKKSPDTRKERTKDKRGQCRNKNSVRPMHHKEVRQHY